METLKTSNLREQFASVIKTGTMIALLTFLASCRPTMTAETLEKIKNETSVESVGDTTKANLEKSAEKIFTLLENRPFVSVATDSFDYLVMPIKTEDGLKDFQSHPSGMFARNFRISKMPLHDHSGQNLERKIGIQKNDDLYMLYLEERNDSTHMTASVANDGTIISAVVGEGKGAENRMGSKLIYNLEKSGPHYYNGAETKDATLAEVKVMIDEDAKLIKEVSDLIK
ncbi:MAG: hypothetical protein JWM20_335 [Patescibacteria group bacterium]|nr:hypothetical protein [Patescibacteria group bacterium]